jgi:hypothetical protein
MPKAKIEPEDNGMALDPLIDALLEHLPAPGDYFAKDERQRWLKILEMALELIYVDEPSGTDGEVTEGASTPRQHGS